MGIYNTPTIYNTGAGGGDWKDISEQITFEENFVVTHNNFRVFLNEKSKILAINFIIELKNLSTTQTIWERIGQIDNVPEIFSSVEIIGFVPGSNYKGSFNFEYDNGILIINYKNVQISNSWFTASNGPIIIPYK